MRRHTLAVPCLAIPFLIAASFVVIAASGAAADDAATSKLPLKKVVLFSSGVGFYEHSAEIDGDAQVELKFRTSDVNDLLKSMVLQDLGGGHISTVTYGSKDPITKTLQTFSIDLTSNPSMGDLLGQVRGEKVEVEAPNKIIGIIVGVEKRKEKGGKDSESIEVDYLNLLTDDGLRSVSMQQIGRIKLLDPKLDGELRQALTVLALGHSTDKKTVGLSFVGNGKRPVRVGYIQESPIWKTSYRLVLDDKEKPLLQGWAIVENTTEEDWKDVGLTLVSGRPISFTMNLYDPLYVSRPVVEPELFASLRPQTYGQDLAKADAVFAQKAVAASSRNEGLNREIKGRRGMGSGAGGAMGGVAGPGAGFSGRGEGPAARPPAPNAASVDFAFASGAIAETGKSVAQAADVGELFQYKIDAPVSLSRQKSAMLPIVNGSVEGQKVAIYNPAVHGKHPLNGLKLKNTTGLHLMQGPITVFDDGAYAGDARIEDLPPGTERLISYAMALDVEVAPEMKASPEQLLSAKLVKGTVYSSRKNQRTLTYTIKNSGEHSKTVLLEYAHDPNWKLVAPAKPAEQTRDLYRFSVKAEPGKPTKLDIEEEQTTEQHVALTNLDDANIRFYLSARVVSEKVKQALSELVKRNAEVGQLTARQQQLEQQIATITTEQDRIRQNMAQLDRNSELYGRYVKKFGEQEDRVEKLRGDISELQGDLAIKRKALDAFLLDLNVE